MPDNCQNAGQGPLSASPPRTRYAGADAVCQTRHTPPGPVA
ncbi:MAG: hypothetical protein V9G08_10450 [Dermatophilaceae bacterium]